MIANKNIISIDSYKHYISDDKELIQSLSCYLKYISNFTNISDALENENINQYLIPALELLSYEGMLKIKDVSNVVTNSFSILEGHLSNTFIDIFLLDNKDDLCKVIEDTYIKDIDNELINYLIKRETKDELQASLIESIKSELDSQEKFNKTISENHISYSEILKYAQKDGDSFDLAKDFIFNFYENFKIDAIDRPIPRLIFNTLSSENQSIVLRDLCDLIYMRDIDVKRQLALLKYFSDLLNYSDDESTSGSRAIARIFNQVQFHPEIASWLDRQNINFSKWNNSDKQSTVSMIASNAALFPRLKEKNPVKNKIQEMTIK
ncbi:hypothetical protein AACK17_17885 [Pectobacterium punjabense]|uniref:hypothetical protein n=1 Tax=Pectobacterium punjabense TaxID=2108399 RepID=UPI00311F8027